VNAIQENPDDPTNQIMLFDYMANKIGMMMIRAQRDGFTASTSTTTATATTAFVPQRSILADPVEGKRLQVGCQLLKNVRVMGK
jgi:hypothetical protein